MKTKNVQENVIRALMEEVFNKYWIIADIVRNERGEVVLYTGRDIIKVSPQGRIEKQEERRKRKYF